MKKITFILMALISGSAFAQSNDSATANAAADIVSPIDIEPVSDLNFGKVANNTAGTVVVATDGNASGLAQIGTTSTTAANFNVTAADGFSYKISLPESVELASGANKITVDTFVHNAGSTPKGTGNAETLAVGATLNVEANQAAGAYTGTFDVTVTYE